MPHTLVPSDHVEGAPVYGSDGAKIGTIERLMLDKRSGVVAYAVVKTPGRFGADQHYYPLSWVALKYNPSHKAYEADVTLVPLRMHLNHHRPRRGRNHRRRTWMRIPPVSARLRINATPARTHCPKIYHVDQLGSVCLGGFHRCRGLLRCTRI